MRPIATISWPLPSVWTCVERKGAFRYNFLFISYDDVIKWKHFPRYWPSVRGIHRLPADSPHKGQWDGALIFSLICAWRNDWANNRDVGILRRHRAHYDVTVMLQIHNINHVPSCLPQKRKHLKDNSPLFKKDPSIWLSISFTFKQW